MNHLFPVRAVSLLLLAATSGGLAPARVGAGEELNLEGLKKEYKEILTARNATRMTGLVKRLAEADDPKGVPYLVDGAVVIPSLVNYQTALKAISRFRNEKTIQELVRLSLEPKPEYFRQRVLILEGFGLRSDPVSRDAIYACLDIAKAKYVHVQVAAIHSCATRKEKEAVPELIKILEKYGTQRDRILVEAREALAALTDEDFDEVQDWKKFWDTHKETLDPKNLNQGKGPTRVVKIKKTKESVEFFGVEILSKNVMFVIDCSGSMELYDEDPDPAQPHKNIEIERQRLKRAKDAMLTAISKLRGRSKFNIIAFNSLVIPWNKLMVPASNENLSSARSFINKFRADKLTHTDDALEKAFEDPNIDTLVLLSDGAPMKQGTSPFNLQDKILSRVKDLNSSRKVRIDTFGFEGEGKVPRKYGGGPAGSSDSMVAFLKKLASQNGGKYQPIK